VPCRQLIFQLNITGKLKFRLKKYVITAAAACRSISEMARAALS
jgi:hypothetical protein